MPVVDASVVVDWVAPDRDHDGPATQVLHRLVDAGVAVVGPTLLIHEVANALLTGTRRGRWDGSMADASFALLSAMPVRLDGGTNLQRAWDLARRYDQHPISDMVYVELAQRTDDVLITADDRLLAKAVPSVVSMSAWLDLVR